ncbi:MAG: flap endonuclease, partial [Myxococcota bacterium]
HDDALLYRTLATLRTDVPLPEEDPDALRWNGAKRDAVEAFCKDTGLGPSAVERIPSWSS